MDGDAELTTKSRDSLHYRKSGGKIYETRTPDGEPAAHAHGLSEGSSTAKRDEQTTLFNWEDEGTSNADRDAKGKGKAITHLETGGGGVKQENIGHSAASSEASDEDDELLPSFGGQDDFDRPVSLYNSSNGKTTTRMSNGSNRRLSLGVHQDGFISRDDMLESDRLGHDTVDHEKPGKESGSSNSKPKRRRKKVDRHNPGRFAREMAFVVSSACPYPRT